MHHHKGLLLLDRPLGSQEVLLQISDGISRSVVQYEGFSSLCARFIR